MLKPNTTRIVPNHFPKINPPIKAIGDPNPKNGNTHKIVKIKKIVDISPTLAKEVIQNQEIENWRANLTRFPNYVFDFFC